MEKRYHHQSKDSTITVGGINNLLDELANVKRNTQQKNIRKSVSVTSGTKSTLPRQDQEQLSSLAYSGVGPLVKKHEMKVRWVQTLFRKRLSVSDSIIPFFIGVSSSHGLIFGLLFILFIIFSLTSVI